GGAVHSGGGSGQLDRGAERPAPGPVGGSGAGGLRGRGAVEPGYAALGAALCRLRARHRPAGPAGSGPIGDSVRARGLLRPRAQGAGNRTARAAGGDLRHPAGLGGRRRAPGAGRPDGRHAGHRRAGFQRTACMEGTRDMTTTTAEVLTEGRGQVGCITLNRPRALNALSLDMVRALMAALLAWQKDDKVLAVAIRGNGREGPFGAFCAGGDIRFLHAAGKDGNPQLEDFFTEEYAL